MSALPDHTPPRPRLNATAAAVLGVSRLMAAGSEPGGSALVRETLVAQTRELLGVPVAALLALDVPGAGTGAGAIRAWLVDAPGTSFPLFGETCGG